MSICLQSYFYNDDSFNFNYAQAKAAVGNFKEAEEVCSILSKNSISVDCLEIAENFSFIS